MKYSHLRHFWACLIETLHFYYYRCDKFEEKFRFPENGIDKWLKMLSSGKYHGIPCSQGTFNKSSEQKLIQIHILKDTAYRVQMEQKRLKPKVAPPNENCQPPSDALLHRALMTELYLTKLY